MTDIRIDCGNPCLEIVLVQEGEEPLRVLRWGLRGSAPDLPPGQPAIEIMTVDAGHAPSTARLTGGVVSQQMRHVRHTCREVDGWQVSTVVLQERDGCLEAELTIEVPPDTAAARASVTLRNTDPGAARTVLAVTSLALPVALGPEPTGSPGDLTLSWARSDWIGESRWERKPLRDAGLPDVHLDAHDSGARGSLSFASTGTWSTGRVLPAGALELTATAGDAGTGAIAWQVEHNGGWRWEVGEHRAGTYLALSGPTDADHQWCAQLAPGETFASVPATLGAGADAQAAFAALTAFRRAARREHADNRALHVVFNDYMNTLMGDPTTEKLLPLIDAAAEAGAEVFCIDAGWYDDSGNWWYSVGDWEPSTVRFPGGLAEVVEHIRRKDMVPGLWLEPEAVGVISAAADQLPAEAFLTRHGERIVEHGRYHLDLRHPAAVAHLDAVVDRLVADLGIGYFKLDYNINPGAGTEVSAHSAGDGLLQHNRAHQRWLDSVLDRHPGLVLENCASGAMRSDFAMLSRLQLQSTSDQQHPAAYPPIAAAAPLLMLPEQAANWAYPQPGMSDEELAFTLCTGLLGRLYLSGHLDGMSVAQQTLVAEAVAAHKRIRHEVATGQASWPLGITQWSAPWVALAVGGRDTRYLTLWKRPGADDDVQIPLPDLRGESLSVDTVFPGRLTPWDWSWDTTAGVLTVRSGDASTAARTLRLSVGRPAQTLLVDVARPTGDVHGGATGMLYGLSDPGIPAAELIAGVRPRTMAQKAPDGAQHPTGDALQLADGYFAADGQEMVIYMQDVLTEWPYEQVEMERYVALAQEMVAKVATRSDRHRFVWVPFNEGDWIWYADWSAAGRDRFLADWSTVHAAIRAVDPKARIGGPNEARYQPHRMRDFLTYCRDHDVLPDVMSWHELQPSSLEVYPAHYAHYRALERQLGIGPLPINIDEYGNRRDMSNPGQLVQWIALFEGTKVDADLAYWTMAGNLDDHAVNTQQANAGWWLLHWYASLRGTTVATQVPHPGVRDSLRAVAAVDGPAAITTVLLGGTADDVTLELHGLGSAGIDGTARARISALPWSGYEGDVAAPVLVSDAAMSVVGGRLTVRVPGGDARTAYRVDITPDGGGAPAEPSPWTRRLDTDAAELVDCVTDRHGDDPQHYTGLGRRGVLVMPQPTSRITFPVVVPEDGTYRLGISYGTEGRVGQQALVVDGGAPQPLRLPATLSRTYTGRFDHDLVLTAGEHRLALQTTADGQQLPDSDLAIDGITLTALRPEPQQRWDAVFAWRSADAAVDYTGATHGPGSMRLPVGSSATFFVGVHRRGAHRLTVTAAGRGTVLVTVGGRRVLESTITSAQPDAVAVTVSLPCGISEVSVRAHDGELVLCSLTVGELGDHAGGGETVARLVPSGAAAWETFGDSRVLTGLGTQDGEQGAVTAEVPELPPGPYNLTVVYSNADRQTGHLYNADVVTRALDVRHGERALTRVPFRHNYDWRNLQEVTVPVELPAPTRSLELHHAQGPGPRVAAVLLEPLVLPFAGVGAVTSEIMAP